MGNPCGKGESVGPFCAFDLIPELGIRGLVTEEVVARGMGTGSATISAHDTEGLTDLLVEPAGSLGGGRFA